MKNSSNYLYSIIICIPLLLGVPVFGQSPIITHQKIPIDPQRWYQITNASSGLHPLFDGDLYTNVHTGYGKILSNYQAFYPVLAGESISIDSIRLFDWEGILATPMQLFAIDAHWNKIPLASFVGNQYSTWVGPYPERQTVFALDTAVTNIRYLLIETDGSFPSEIELYGFYHQPNPLLPKTKKTIPLSNYFGINAYEWDFLNPLINPFVIDENRFASVKNFTSVRHYMDWQKLEQTEGNYTFSPTHSGGWNYDTIYSRCKDAGIEILTCLKTVPDWILNTYPESERDNENNPLQFGKNLINPLSYIEQARVGFQYIARYGYNKNIDSNLVKVNNTPRWTNDDINTKKIGMGLIHYIECENERDKWWKGRKAYQTGREYAANLSAFYDGHKNSMGAGVGVKNADSTIKVVMAGVALTNTDYLKAMIDWCKEFRGYKPDGSINLCWDISNYHLYSTDPSLNRGVAPEKSIVGIGADSTAKAFINMAHQYLNEMPVWVTESGYDINEESPNKAIAIGNKTVLQTQADWLLRTALLYARNGIDHLFFYQLQDDNPLSSALYGTSGLINQNLTPRPASDYIRQTNKLFGRYHFIKTLSTDPMVDMYSVGDSLMYVIYIPDEIGRKSRYLLNIPNTDSALLYRPAVGKANMTLSKQKINNGLIAITATETPVFVVGRGRSTVHQLSNPITIFPNPANNTIIVDGLSSDTTAQMTIINSAGNPLKTITSRSPKITIDISTITPATYFMIINYGRQQRILPFIIAR